MPSEHQTAHFPHDEPQSDDDSSTIYLEANSRPSFPSHEYTLTDLKREFAKVNKERLEIMNRLTSLAPLPSPEPLEKRLERLEVSLKIGTVVAHLGGHNYGPAMMEACTALKKARETGSEILIARCYYWMGRIAFKLKNFAAAYVHFKAARPCVMNEESLEGIDVEFYLGLSRSGISEEYRKRALHDHNRAIVEGWEEQNPSDRRVVVKSEKRKRDSKTWELVLRPAADRPSRGQSGQRAGTAKRKQNRGKPTVWMVHDTADLPQYRNAPGASKDATQDRKSVTKGTEWLAAQQSHPPLEGRLFTFRCYLSEISTRTRLTNIFSPQPCEVILTDEEWNFLREGLKGTHISLSYLVRERKMLSRVKRRREAEALEKQAEAAEVGDK